MLPGRWLHHTVHGFTILAFAGEHVEDTGGE